MHIGNNNANPNRNNNLAANLNRQNPLAPQIAPQIAQPLSPAQIQERLNVIHNSGFNFVHHQMVGIRRGLESDSPEARNFFSQTPPEILIQFDGNQMYGIKLAFESNSPESRNFFSQTPPEILVQFDDIQMRGITAGLESNSPESRNFFSQTPPEILVQFHGNQIDRIRLAFESNSPECRNFFSQTPPEILAEFDGNQMYGITVGLESNSPESRNFFSQTPPEILARFNANQMRGIRLAFEGNNPIVLNRINTDRDTARQNYFDNAPANAPQEILEANIAGLYAPMISQIINHTQRALNELGIAPQEAYSQKIDRSEFNKIRGRMYAEGATQGLLSKTPIREVGRNIGRFLSASDVQSIAGVNRAARNAAEAEYNRLNPNHGNP